MQSSSIFDMARYSLLLSHLLATDTFFLPWATASRDPYEAKGRFVKGVVQFGEVKLHAPVPCW
jgi:hypothetical protein